MVIRRSIGRYEIVRRVGYGGMGALYLATDPNLGGREVASKLLHADMEQPEVRERFAREASAAANLDHVNIVTIFDYGEVDDEPFIVMEFLRGETLGDLIKARRPLFIQDKLLLLEQLCGGLAYAHDRGIIHRDVKPANLMVKEDGTLKILDFGIARLRDSSMTRLSSPMGTPGYMAPEQILGKTVDARSDLFAVGVVAYELLTYREAFGGDTQHQIAQRVVAEEPAPIRSLSPEVSGELAAVVERALRKHPADRHADANSLRIELEGIRSELPPVRRTPMPTPTPRRLTPLPISAPTPLPRRPEPFGRTPVPTPAPEPELPDPSELEPSGPSRRWLGAAAVGGVVMAGVLAVVFWPSTGTRPAAGPGDDPPPRTNELPVARVSCDPCDVPFNSGATLTATASDPDSDELTYEWTANAGTMVNAMGPVARWVSPGVARDVVATVTVRDGRGGETRASVQLAVRAPSTPRKPPPPPGPVEGRGAPSVDPNSRLERARNALASTSCSSVSSARDDMIALNRESGGANSPAQDVGRQLTIRSVNLGCSNEGRLDAAQRALGSPNCAAVEAAIDDMIKLNQESGGSNAQARALGGQLTSRHQVTLGCPARR